VKCLAIAIPAGTKSLRLANPEICKACILELVQGVLRRLFVEHHLRDEGCKKRYPS